MARPRIITYLSNTSDGDRQYIASEVDSQTSNYAIKIWDCSADDNWTKYYSDYAFSHWNTERDDSGTTWYVNTPVPTDTQMTLYSIWVPKKQQYWVSAESLIRIADAIRKASNNYVQLIYPSDFIEALNDISE